tara:strand:- start:1695 stop:1904 length:210 start_codon:yes stop_codon:yes gene_type:complete
MASSSTDVPVDVSKADDKTYTVSSNDIQLMLSVVNVVSVRGGFKPTEFKQVGELFEKLSELTKDEKKQV